MNGRSRSVFAAVVASLVSGCGRERPMGAAAAQVGSTEPASVATYLAPPRATAVESLREGALRITGSAPPGAIVQLASPEGDTVAARSDARGLWRLRLPGAGTPRLYAMSARSGDRLVRADGALVTTPGAVAPAVVVRAGDAARPLLAGAGTVIAAVDYDPSGALAVSGSAPAGAAVTLLIDGAVATVGHADDHGIFEVLAANHRPGLGTHVLSVYASGRSATRQVTLTRVAPLVSPYRAEPAAGGGWRVEWALTGGGEQTTVVPAP